MDDAILSNLLLKIDQTKTQLDSAESKLKASLAILKDFILSVERNALHEVKPSGEFLAFVPKQNVVCSRGIVPTSQQVAALFNDVKHLTKTLQSLQEDLRRQKGEPSASRPFDSLSHESADDSIGESEPDY